MRKMIDARELPEHFPDNKGHTLLEWFGAHAEAGTSLIVAQEYATTAHCFAILGWVQVVHDPRDRPITIKLTEAGERVAFAWVEPR